MMTPEQIDKLFQMVSAYFVSTWQRDRDRKDIVMYVDSLLAQARADALEEAAKICDPKNPPSDWTTYATTRADCAKAIRARKGGQ